MTKRNFYLPVMVAFLTISCCIFALPCNAQRGVAKIVILAEHLKETLSPEQVAALQLAYTFSNIKTWSNLPAAMSRRVGIRLGDLNARQLEAAKALVKEISGTTVNEGWDEVQQIWAADDYLAAKGGGRDYSAGEYYLAFFGTPGISATFEIMMTGHHKTVANTYANGVLIAATPHFSAIEPLSFTSGTATYAPLNQERDAFVAILNSLNTEQLNTAKLSSTYSDVLLGPSRNWQFPATRTGLQCNVLNAAQKKLVVAALKTYVYDIDDVNAAKILATYTAALDSTFISYTGTTSMTTRNDYFRIDGPRVWIEFSTQNAVVTRGIHYHSVWRDRLMDYGGTH